MEDEGAGLKPGSTLAVEQQQKTSMRSLIQKKGKQKTDQGGGHEADGKQGGEEKGLRVRWSHQLRLEHDDKQCFICKKRDEPLERCGFAGSVKGKKDGRCPINFHHACLVNYDAGGYHHEFLHNTFGRSVCSRHYCDACFLERRKTTATHRDGLDHLIECDTCYRAFHVECRPAGPDHEKMKNVAAIPDPITAETCHSHFAQDLVPDVCWERFTQLKKPHSGICCECELKDKDENGKKIDSAIVNCSNCARSFHVECHKPFDKVFGLQWQGKNTSMLCESCVNGEFPRVGQHFLAYFAARGYSSGFYACMAVDQTQFPASKAAQREMFYDGIGYPGFVPVQWLGPPDCFAMVPLMYLVPMTSNSLSILKPKSLSASIGMAWQWAQDHPAIPRPHFTREAGDVKLIKTSVYHSDCPPLSVMRNERMESEKALMCECKTMDGERCGPGCVFRHFAQECPPLCNSKGVCLNRRVSQQESFEGVEKRYTETKGQGIFATQSIPPNTFIGEYAGEIITQAMFDERQEESARMRNMEEQHYTMALDGYYVDAKYMGSFTRYMNHSCQPNCKVTTVSVYWRRRKGKDGGSSGSYENRVYIVTTRAMEEGEELTFDYDMVQQKRETHLRDHYMVVFYGVDLPACLCGAEKCRGKLGRTADERKQARKKSDKSVTPEAVERAGDGGMKEKKTVKKRGAKQEKEEEARASKRAKHELPSIQHQPAAVVFAPPVHSQMPMRPRLAARRVGLGKEEEDMGGSPLVPFHPHAMLTVQKAGNQEAVVELSDKVERRGEKVDRDAPSVTPDNKENATRSAEDDGTAIPGRGIRRRCKKRAVYTP